MPQNLVWDAPRMSDLIKTFAWVTKEHSTALRNLASKITKYYVSYVKIVDGKVVSISPENAHTPTVENLLYRVHVQPYTKDPGEKVGRVADCRIGLEELEDIRKSVAEAIRVIDGNRYPAGCISLCLEPFADVGFDLLKLMRSKDVTSNKAIERYEKKAVTKLRKKLTETQWDKLPKAEPPPLTETYTDLSKRFLKEDFWMPYLERYPTDFDRVISVFYLSVREIDNAFYEYKELVKSCKEKSGFLKGPPPDLTQNTMQAMNKFFHLLLGLVVPCNLSDKYIKQPVFKNEALKEVDKALKKISEQGYINGKDAKKLVGYYLGFGSPNSITRWMNR